MSSQDWPLVYEPQLGLGPHLASQVDEAAPMRASYSKESIVNVPMGKLYRGTHRLSGYASYSLGEAVKHSVATLQWHLNVIVELPQTQL